MGEFIYHGIKDWLGLGETLEIISFTPCHVQGDLPLPQGCSQPQIKPGLGFIYWSDVGWKLPQVTLVQPDWRWGYFWSLLLASLYILHIKPVDFLTENEATTGNFINKIKNLRAWVSGGNRSLSLAQGHCLCLPRLCHGFATQIVTWKLDCLRC